MAVIAPNKAQSLEIPVIGMLSALWKPNMEKKSIQEDKESSYLHRPLGIISKIVPIVIIWGEMRYLDIKMMWEIIWKKSKWLIKRNENLN